MVLVVFRSRLREGANIEELTALTERMYKLVSALPGFRGMKDYQAEDGETVSIAEFDSLEAVAAWREHPEHRRAQERGRREFFREYSVQVCTTIRESIFPRP
jgi:heme-degrading monooxygenase HmoA